VSMASVSNLSSFYKVSQQLPGETGQNWRSPLSRQPMSWHRIQYSLQYGDASQKHYRFRRLVWYWCVYCDGFDQRKRLCDECLYLVAGQRPADQWVAWVVMTWYVT
jgi:hypothetical protein